MGSTQKQLPIRRDHITFVHSLPPPASHYRPNPLELVATSAGTSDFFAYAACPMAQPSPYVLPSLFQLRSSHRHSDKIESDLARKCHDAPLFSTHLPGIRSPPRRAERFHGICPDVGPACQPASPAAAPSYLHRPLDARRRPTLRPCCRRHCCCHRLYCHCTRTGGARPPCGTPRRAARLTACLTCRRTLPACAPARHLACRTCRAHSTGDGHRCTYLCYGTRTCRTAGHSS